MLNKKVYDALLTRNIDTLKARLISRRTNDIEQAFKIAFMSFQDLSSPFYIEEMDKAVSRILISLSKKEIIGIETDYDCDGQTSHAVLLKALTKIFDHPREYIKSYIGNRLKDGYGLSENLIEQIKKDKVSLVITADNGSSDEESISRLLQCGIDTIVTDHHIVTVRPPSAYAFINPTRSLLFKDPYIAGCMVAWLLMASLYKYCKNRNIPLGREQIVDLLDYVALGTSADCVDLGLSINNRIVVKYGLKIINQLKRPVWKIFLDQARYKHSLDTESLRFLIAPFLNAASRVGEVFDGLNLLLSDTFEEASIYFSRLKNSNEERKIIQQALNEDAGSIAYTKNQNNNTLCIFLEKGHIGLSGIIASKLVTSFKKPVAILAPSYIPDVLAGSIRSLENIDIKNILDNIAFQHPDLLLKYGGHKKAAGFSIKRANVEDFEILFEESTRCTLVLKDILPISKDTWRTNNDGPLPDRDMTSIQKILQELEPYGEGFEDPIFYDKAVILDIIYSLNKLHVFFRIKIRDKLFRAALFYFQEHTYSPTFKLYDKIIIAYHISAGRYLGEDNLIIKRILKI